MFNKLRNYGYFAIYGCQFIVKLLFGSFNPPGAAIRLNEKTAGESTVPIIGIRIDSALPSRVLADRYQYSCCVHRPEMLNLECSVGIGRNASVTIFEPDYNHAIIFAFVSDSFSVRISDLFHGDTLLSCRFEKNCRHENIPGILPVECSCRLNSLGSARMELDLICCEILTRDFCSIFRRSV